MCFGSTGIFWRFVGNFEVFAFFWEFVNCCVCNFKVYFRNMKFFWSFLKILIRFFEIFRKILSTYFGRAVSLG